MSTLQNAARNSLKKSQSRPSEIELQKEGRKSLKKPRPSEVGSLFSISESQQQLKSGRSSPSSNLTELFIQGADLIQQQRSIDMAMLKEDPYYQWQTHNEAMNEENRMVYDLYQRNQYNLNQQYSQQLEYKKQNQLKAYQLCLKKIIQVKGQLKQLDNKERDIASQLGSLSQLNDISNYFNQSNNNQYANTEDMSFKSLLLDLQNQNIIKKQSLLSNLEKCCIQKDTLEREYGFTNLSAQELNISQQISQASQDLSNINKINSQQQLMINAFRPNQRQENPLFYHPTKGQFSIGHQGMPTSIQTPFSLDYIKMSESYHQLIDLPPKMLQFQKAPQPSFSLNQYKNIDALVAQVARERLENKDLRKQFMEEKKFDASKFLALNEQARLDRKKKAEEEAELMRLRRLQGAGNNGPRDPAQKARTQSRGKPGPTPEDLERQRLLALRDKEIKELNDLIPEAMKMTKKYLLEACQRGFKLLTTDKKLNVDISSEKKLVSGELKKRTESLQNMSKVFVDCLVDSLTPTVLDKKLIDFFAKLTKEFSFPPTNYLSQFEIDRIRFTRFGQYLNQSKPAKEMQIIHFMLIRMWLLEMVVKPWVVLGIPETPQLKANSYFIAGVIHTLILEHLKNNTPVFNNTQINVLKQFMHHVKPGIMKARADVEIDKVDEKDFYSFGEPLILGFPPQRDIGVVFSDTQWTQERQSTIQGFGDYIEQLVEKNQKLNSSFKFNILEVMKTYLTSKGI